MNEKNKGNLWLVGVIMFIFAAIVIGKGVTVLTEKSSVMSLDELWNSQDAEGSYVEGDIYSCSQEYFTLDNSINLIPVGTEHYYIVFDKELTKCVTVKASESFEEEFDSASGMNLAGVTIQGIVKPITESSQKRQIDLIEQEWKAEGILLDIPMYYIDCQSNSLAILSIGCGIAALVLTAFTLAIVKSGRRNTVTEWIVAILWVVDIFLIVRVWMMG